jgi:hypothetical protein
MARSIAGLFADRASAEVAVADLLEQGFDPAHVGVIVREDEPSLDMAGAAPEELGKLPAEGAVAGGLIGGTTGALLVASGVLAIPAVGPFLSAGVLATLVGGSAGALVGALAGVGISEAEARYYEDEVQKGRALLTVEARGREGRRGGSCCIMARHRCRSC